MEFSDAAAGYRNISSPRKCIPRVLSAHVKYSPTPLTIVSVLAITACDRPKNVCPIDGQPPRGVVRRSGQSCEYFHYSDIERKTHS